MREFLEQPITVSNLLAITAGWIVGKVSVSYFEYRRWRKRNAEWNDEMMRQAGYRD